MIRVRSTIAIAFLTACSLPAGAQEFRVRIDARAQSVSFRELLLDSVAVAEAVQTPDGGFQTSDGHALRCGAASHCYFFRPGAGLRGIPLATTASITAWGFGVQGLSLRSSGRLISDIGRDDVWPGTEPRAQLIEGYLEYQRWPLLARAGRQYVSSRLEPMGFDGGWLRGRWDRRSLEFTGYAGWGLGQGAVIPVTNPVLNPLDEWRPRKRQRVAGVEAAWLYRNIDARAEYRREIDPEDNAFVSERTALSVAARASSLRFNGGFDYNIAEAQLGNADATLTWLRATYSLSAGARRYRPYFSLWTLWGAFSPVPYNAAHASAQWRALSWLSLLARAERFAYEDAAVSTGLVPQLTDDGWRTRLAATATLDSIWTVDASYGVERGPGASSRYADAAIAWSPGDRYSLEVYAGTLERPLELRFYDAKSRWLGGRAQWRLSQQRRVWADVALVSDDRERPDAGASSLSQSRLRAGVSVTFGSSGDRSQLPPARPLGR